jgi:hypothetical protein
MITLIGSAGGRILSTTSAALVSGDLLKGLGTAVVCVSDETKSQSSKHRQSASFARLLVKNLPGFGELNGSLDCQFLRR